ncbi:MAG: hypothetical protein KIS67_22930 [Verrucomicrobiae bacterium]|nr:hypothetical protein [Verrucomicrobiae bacterium]
MTTSPLISHRLFVAALSQEKAKGPDRTGPPGQFPAAAAADARTGEAHYSAGDAGPAGQRSLVSEGVSVGLRFLRA